MLAGSGGLGYRKYAKGCTACYTRNTSSGYTSSETHKELRGNVGMFFLVRVLCQPNDSAVQTSPIDSPSKQLRLTFPIPQGVGRHRPNLPHVRSVLSHENQKIEIFNRNGPYRLESKSPSIQNIRLAIKGQPNTQSLAIRLHFRRRNWNLHFHGQGSRQ